jgi:hypothetical protein
LDKRIWVVNETLKLQILKGKKMRLFAFLLILCSFFTFVYSEPPRKIPSDLLNQFTMNGKIPVFDWYLDNTSPQPQFQVVLQDGNYASKYSKEMINGYVEKIKMKESFYYGETDIWLYQALEKYPIDGKEVAIVGSTLPWYESIVIAYGGRPTTIEYNKIVTDDDRLIPMTVTEFNQHPRKFDIILSISSIEHDGLGRYGDPVNPNADLEFMSMAKEKLLKEDGAMILAVPVGRDCLYWNANRVYGHLRLPLLLKGWNVTDSFGFKKSEFFGKLGNYGYQPIFYLIPEHTP